MVSPVRRDGTARPRATTTDGAALKEARRRKERTYPELAGEGGRARFVVIGVEVGGRWSAESAQLLSARQGPVLGRRGFAVESAAARVCREAGARVSLDVRVQDMDLARPDALDNRRLEVVAVGLPLFQGAQLVDTTAVSVLRRDGAPRRRVVSQDGAALDAARRRKERVYPELTGQLGHTRLVVLTCEVAGRWAEECVEFINQLAKAKARREPRYLRGRARQAWRQRWATLLACSAAKAFGLSLLERRGGLGPTASPHPPRR